MINIIGAGMAGSILAKLLKLDGIEYRLFDDPTHKYKSSPISENLIGTTWYTPEERVTALRVLDKIVPIRLINTEFTNAHHVYVSDLLETNFIAGHATPVEEGTLLGSTLYKGTNVICTGAWAGPFVRVKAMAGHGYILEGKREEWIRGDWKPFRHLKFIEFDRNRMWFGNTVVVGQGKYWEERPRYAKELAEIAVKYGVLSEIAPRAIHVGYRPKTEVQEIVEVAEGYVITGGYKSGMVCYPRMCEEMLKLIKLKKL